MTFSYLHCFPTLTSEGTFCRVEAHLIKIIVHKLYILCMIVNIMFFQFNDIERGPHGKLAFRLNMFGAP